MTTIHTDQGDITIADGATTGTLAIAANNGEDVYSDASSLTAAITGVSGGGFESLVVGTATATANVSDTVTTATVTLDNAVAGGTPGTATITAHVDHAVTGSDLIVNLSNGASITIAVGATSGTSASFAATADAVIGISSYSGGNFEELDTSDHGGSGRKRRPRKHGAKRADSRRRYQPCRHRPIDQRCGCRQRNQRHHHVVGGAWHADSVLGRWRKRIRQWHQLGYADRLNRADQRDVGRGQQRHLQGNV